MKRASFILSLLTILISLFLVGCGGDEKKKAPVTSSLPAKQEAPRALSLTKEGLYRLSIENFPSYTAGVGWGKANMPINIKECLEVRNGTIKEGPGLGVWKIKVLSANRDGQGKLKIEIELTREGKYDNGKPHFKEFIRGTITEDHGDSWIIYGKLTGNIRLTSFKYDGSLEYDVNKDFTSPVTLSNAT